MREYSRHEGGLNGLNTYMPCSDVRVLEILYELHKRLVKYRYSNVGT